MYFNRPYIVSGLALYRSLKARIPNLTVWVLCLDDFTYDVVNRLDQPDLRAVSWREFEKDDPALEKAKQDRSLVEYIFTLKPCWPLYLLRKFPEIDLITHADADLFFFRDPGPVYAEMGDASFLLVPHHFPDRLRRMEVYGHYNAGGFTVRNDDEGRACLQWWRARCLEWCHDRVEDNKFTDQKYLEELPKMFGRVRICRHKGWGVAPWNWMSFDIARGEDGWTVDGEPLVMFHFHGLKFVNRWLYDPVSTGRDYGEMPPRLRWPLYAEYMRALIAAERWVRSVEPQVTLYSVHHRGKAYGWKGLLRKAVTMRLMVHGH
jgi:hypothetical protein